MSYHLTAGLGLDRRPARYLGRVATGDVDRYLADLEQPGRGTLEAVRSSIRRALPDAEEDISYGMPAYRLHGKVVAGFAAFKNHLSYLPHSGSVLAQLADDLAGYRQTTSAPHFAIDEPLPAELIDKLIATRLDELPRR